MELDSNAHKVVVLAKLNLITPRQLCYICTIFWLLAVTTACQPAISESLTLSLTPRSTPLPVVPTPALPGQRSIPLQIVMVPYSGIDEAQPVVVDLVSAIKTETGLVVEFRLVEQMSQALSALCNSGSSVGVAAWLDGLAYSIARSLGCGQPVLQVERGRGVGANTGVASSIIARKSLSINDLLELVGRRFCRINQADSLSWLVPSILMKKEGLSVTELRTVSDFDDTESLITAVVRGDCDAAGVPSDALDQFAEQFGDEYEKIAVVATSPVIPYSVLVVADDLPLSIQEGFGDALQRLAQNRTIGQKLQLLLNQSALQKAREIDFDDFIGFMMSVGMDFVQLGN